MFGLQAVSGVVKVWVCSKELFANVEDFEVLNGKGDYVLLGVGKGELVVLCLGKMRCLDVENKSTCGVRTSWMKIKARTRQRSKLLNGTGCKWPAPHLGQNRMLPNNLHWLYRA